MKIIQKDNYDRETRSEQVVAENVSPYFSELICRLLNERGGPDSDDYYTSEPDDYRPYVYKP